MGAFSWIPRVLNLARTVPEDPQRAHNFFNFWPGRTVSGVTMTEERAFALSAFSACLKVLSEDYAKMPNEVFQWEADGLNKRRVPGRVERMLNCSPNPDMTGFTFWQTMVSDMLVWGNAYAEIEKDIAGRAIALHPLNPERVEPMRDHISHQLFYRVKNHEHGQVDLRPSDVFHVPGLCRGVAGFGMPALSYMAETLGEAVAMRDYSSAFFANDARPGGLLTTDATLKDTTWERLKASWEEVHKGARQSHKVAILEAGMKWQAMAGNNDTAQLMESRSFTVVEVARFLRVPLHKIAHLDDASYNNIEALERAYASDSQAPIVKKFEQEIDRKIFGQNRGNYFVRVNMDELTRGDMLARYQAKDLARKAGIINADEWRASEDMNPIGGIAGKTYWMPSNTIPSDKAYDQAQIQREDKQDPDDGPDPFDLDAPTLNLINVQNAFRHILVGASKSCWRREANWAKRRAKRSANWDEELRNFLWDEKSLAACRRDFEPAVTGIATAVAMPADEVARRLDALIEAHLKVSYGRLSSDQEPHPDNFDEQQALDAVARLFSFQDRLAAA